MSQDEFESALRRIRLVGYAALLTMITASFAIPLIGACVFIFRNDAESAQGMIKIAIAPVAIAAVLTLLRHLRRHG